MVVAYSYLDLIRSFVYSTLGDLIVSFLHSIQIDVTEFLPASEEKN